MGLMGLMAGLDGLNGLHGLDILVSWPIWQPSLPVSLVPAWDLKMLLVNTHILALLSYLVVRSAMTSFGPLLI
jgi:hypothetical protein